MRDPPVPTYTPGLMRDYRIRTDLERERLGEIAFALGLLPKDLPLPCEGYVVDYVTAEGDEPDGYHFHVTISHERLDEVLERLFQLLSGEVFPILELGSRDAYRAVDVWMAPEPITRTEFLRTWADYRGFLLEDGTVSAGANCDEPAVEIFVDHWKGISVHVPLMMRDDVEEILESFRLPELSEPWLGTDEDEPLEMESRPILDISEPDLPDVEDVLMDLRELWRLELNVDPQANVDDAGRSLGITLWYVLAVLSPRQRDREGAYGSIWLTAGSLEEAERLARDAVNEHPELMFEGFHSIDRVAHDERPDDLGDLPPRPRSARVHLVGFEPWSGPDIGMAGGGGDGRVDPDVIGRIGTPDSDGDD